MDSKVVTPIKHCIYKPNIQHKKIDNVLEESVIKSASKKQQKKTIFIKRSNKGYRRGKKSMYCTQKQINAEKNI